MRFLSFICLNLPAKPFWSASASALYVGVNFSERRLLSLRLLSVMHPSDMNIENAMKEKASNLELQERCTGIGFQLGMLFDFRLSHWIS